MCGTTADMKLVDMTKIVGTCSALLLACSSPKTETEAKPVEKVETKPAEEKVEPPPSPAEQGIPAPADVAAPPADAEKTASGIASKVLQEGSGEKPGPEDEVEVHYTGWLTTGEMFDSSVKRGEPAVFPLNRVIKGWTEGVQLMKVGEKRRFWIPGKLAYGEAPPDYTFSRPGRPLGTLVFDIELLSIPRPPEPPKDLKKPHGAKKTASGLKHKVLEKGSGSEHPKETDRVTVHYSGWTTDGELFDSSVERGQPASFELNRVIKGWTEGLQLMVEGEKRRFWIPGDLAYGEAPKGWTYRPGGPPLGTLVFDVELIKIN